ncbi:thiosulfate oxidation carrier complex protein SoxZ [Magnetococcales bacterium HHB-1]
MSSIGRAKIRIPQMRGGGVVKAGDVIEVQALIRHPMETGLRKDKKTKKLVPAYFINKVEAQYNGETVMSADWGAAVSADPFISFFVQAKKTGPLKLTWKDNKGGVYSRSIDIKVQ